VVITDDGVDENNETVILTLSNPVNATLGVINPAMLTITDNDSMPTVQFSSAAYSVNENSGPAIITVTLSAASSFTITVNYATSNGTAIAGSDYLTTSGVLTFAPAVTTRTFTVVITDDGVYEPDETVLLGLSSAVNAILDASNPVTLTIINHQAMPGSAESACRLSCVITVAPSNSRSKMKPTDFNLFSLWHFSRDNHLPKYSQRQHCLCGEFSAGPYQVTASSSGPGCGSTTVTLDFRPVSAPDCQVWRAFGVAMLLKRSHIRR